MKLGSVIKVEKRNMAKPKQIHDDTMSTNCDIIAISDYGQFEATRKLDP